LVGGDEAREASWAYTDDEGKPLDWVGVSPSSPIFFMWRAWRQHGTLPVKGDYADQPIHLLAQIEAIEMVVGMKTIIEADDSDWTKLTAEQVAMKRWLDKVNV
jgi:hypothetical protein